MSTVKEFREKTGTLAEKIVEEFRTNTTVAKGDLAAGVTNAIAFAWQNPESTEIMIHAVVIDVTTAGGTGSSVLDVDVVANATATDDTIIDGLDLNAVAISTSTNVSDSGTNGDEKPHKADEKGGSNDYVTGKILVANASSLVGKYYIHYTKV